MFAATDALGGPRVALKLLSRKVLDLAGGEPRMRRETDLASRLNHPNIVRVLDTGVDASGNFYIAFELLLGRTLEEEMERQGALAPARAAHITCEVLAALEEAHRAGVVHRDLKPANVFLADGSYPDGVKILDFGIAKSINPGTLVGLTQQGQALGTPAYMAPEQAMGREVGPVSDLFALGMMLAEMLLGRPVYDATSSMLDILRERLLGQPPPIPASLRATPLGAVVLRATEPDPGRRFGSAAEMRAALLALLPSLPSQAGAIGTLPTAFPSTGSAAFAATHGVPVAHPTAAPAWSPAPWQGPVFAPAPPRPASRALPIVVIFAIALPVLLVLGGAGVAAYVLSNRGAAPARPPASPRRTAAPPEPPSVTSPEGAGALRILKCDGAGAITQPTLQSQLRALGWEVKGTLLRCSGDMVNFQCLGPEGRGFTVARSGVEGNAVTVRLKSPSDLDGFLRTEQSQSGERTIAHDRSAALRLEMSAAEADRLIARLCK